MTATLKIAQLIDILSTSGEIVSRDDLMKKVNIKDTRYFQTLLDNARQEIGIFTITKPNGFIGYKINYEDVE